MTIENILVNDQRTVALVRFPVTYGNLQFQKESTDWNQRESTVLVLSWSTTKLPMDWHCSLCS